jgi:methylglutaconyl-CoA hydratase
MKYLRTEKIGSILHLTLNRPEKRNAFNADVVAELTSVFSDQKLGSSIRLIHLSAIGPDFCAGADLQWMATFQNHTPEDNIADASALWAMYMAMQQCAVPILTQVQGRSLGGGVGLCAASDVVVAEDSSVFALSEVARGLVPGVMMPFIVQKMGPSRTRELTITARSFDAASALQYGLVHHVAQMNQIESIVTKLCSAILHNGPSAVLESRRLLNTIVSQDLNRNIFIQSLAAIRSGSEAAEGMNAFLSKRPPTWAKPVVRTAVLGDLSKIVRLENSRWSPEQRCSEENFVRRLESHPDGMQVAELGEHIVGSFYAVRRPVDKDQPFYWMSGSGDGTGSSHDPKANGLFSVSVTVAENAPSGTYRSLMEGWRALARRQGVKYIFAGSRIPGLANFPGTADEYVKDVTNGKLYDPILSKGIANGFRVGRIIPEYFHDPESRNFGVEIYDEL